MILDMILILRKVQVFNVCYKEIKVVMSRKFFQFVKLIFSNCVSNYRKYYLTQLLKNFCAIFAKIHGLFFGIYVFYQFLN